MTAGPFASLALITPVLLTADGIAPYAHGLATVLIDVLVVLIVLLGGWFTGIWMRGGVDLDRLHPGYFLPTVAGGLVASTALFWIASGQGAAGRVLSYLVLAAISLLVAGVTVRTAVAIARGSLLPAVPASEVPPPQVDAGAATGPTPALTR